MPFTATQRERLTDSARTYGIALDDTQVQQCERITDLLLEWNQRINLTGMKTVDDVLDKHIIDSLAGHPHVRDDAFVLDIGTGGGFPGLPLKIAGPRRRLLLIDGTAKKITYLTQLIHELGLQGISAMHQRAEEKGFQFGLSRQVDVVTARAVAATPELLKLGAPYLKPGGLLLLYKGVSEAEEVMAGREQGAAFHPPELHRYTLPAGDERALLLFRRR